MAEPNNFKPADTDRLTFFWQTGGDYFSSRLRSIHAVFSCTCIRCVSKSDVGSSLALSVFGNTCIDGNLRKGFLSRDLPQWKWIRV
jgi:hypothetical protein